MSTELSNFKIYQFNVYDVHWNLVDVWYRSNHYQFKNDGDYISSKDNRGFFVYIKFMGETPRLKKEIES